MRHRFLFLVAAIVSAAQAVSALDWGELLAERLQEDVSYRQAVLQHRGAVQALDQLELFFVPYVSVGFGSSGPGGRMIYNGELGPLGIRPSITFSGLLGTEIEL